MRIVFDVEGNGFNPTQVWCIVCKDIDTEEYHIFRRLSDETERQRFLQFAEKVSCFIGHHILGYDLPVLVRLLGLPHPDIAGVVDTLIVSKLVDYSRPGHSIEDYGKEFGLEKGKF